jgi:hypothetical protein
VNLQKARCSLKNNVLTQYAIHLIELFLTEVLVLFFIHFAVGCNTERFEKVL